MTVLELILTLVVSTPNHELNKDPLLNGEVTEYFIEAAEKHGTVFKPDEKPALLYVLWAFGESSLRIDVVGARGEVGYCQAHGVARADCEANGYDPTTRRGGALCVGLLMQMGVNKCGSLKRGLWWYASGKCNGTPRARRITERRLRRWRKIQKR